MARSATAVVVALLLLGPLGNLTASAATGAADGGAANGGGGAGRQAGGVPVVIAHRGAAGYRPEHTLAAYELAIDQGADFVEPDLVATRDGVLVARHENEISATTDVAAHAEFADRRRTKRIDGRDVTGWFTEDLSLAELKTLRARERLPQLRPANTAFDGRFEVPTLQEIVDLVRAREATTGRRTGLYLETKHPAYYRSIGLALEPALTRTLHRNGLAAPAAPVVVESFDAASLRALDTMVDVPLVQLLAANDQRMATPNGLARIARYADGIGPDKSLVVPLDAAGNRGTPTRLVSDAHAAGLLVHVWTFRAEAEFRARDLPDDVAEYRLFYSLGVDGVFSEFPDHAGQARITSTSPPPSAPS